MLTYLEAQLHPERIGGTLGEAIVQSHVLRNDAMQGMRIAFAWFKFAVILEGVHYRATHGETAGEGFDGVAGLVQPLVERGLAALAGDTGWEPHFR